MNPLDDIDLEARAIAVFKSCCDLNAADRERVLAEATAGDKALFERVSRLIAADLAAMATDLSAPVLGDGQGRRLLLDDMVARMSSGDEEEDALPETLGPYRIIGLLGAGGMGLVYEAEQERPKRRVAVKTVHPHLRTNAVVDHFRREVELLGSLGHPAIPQAFEAGEEGGTVWLAMELVRGRRLLEHTVNQPWRQRITLIIEIIDGVASAHDAGIIHCDLTPDNVLVTANGQPKILDFGLAIGPAADPTRAVLAASHDYIAPEQRMLGRLDARVDVFALGRMLGAVMRDAPLPKMARRELEAIVAHATAHSPTDRYGSARELGEDLRRFAAQRPTRAHPASPLHRLRLIFLRNQQAVRALGLAFIAVALVVLGAWVWGVIANRRVEEQAATRFETLRQRVVELEKAGEYDRADAAFYLYARMTEHLGTRALHEAWVWRAQHEGARHAVESAIEAWAEAVTSATTRQDELMALTRLADAFARAGQWRPLDHVLGRIDRLDEREAVADTQALRFRTATFHRRLEEARALGSQHPTAPVIAALSRGRRVANELSFVQPMRWHDRDLLLVRGPDTPHVWLLDPRADFAKVGETTLGLAANARLPRALMGAEGWLVGIGANGRGVLRHFDGGAELELPLGSVHDAVGWHDGGLRAIVGGAGDDRGVYALALDHQDGGAAALKVTRAPPAVSAPVSDTDAVVRGDLDGDGVAEVVIGLGAWGAYDLRVFRVDERGTFQALARRSLGVLGGLALLPMRGSSTLIAAAKVDRYPSVTTFGARAPYGPPAGVYLFAYREGALEERGFLPVPDGVGVVHELRNLMAGDFDGDGLTDLALHVSLFDGHVTMLMRQVEGQRFEPIAIRDVIPLAVVEADEDPARELLVGVEDDGDRTTWVLGAGDASLPHLRPLTGLRPRSVTADLDELALEDADDPALSRVWQGAKTLRELGLIGRAADNLEAASMLAGSPALEAIVLSEAAGLRLELNEARRAAQLFDQASSRAAAGSATQLAAISGAARSWLAAIEPRLALERYRRLLEHEGSGQVPVEVLGLLGDARANTAYLDRLVGRDAEPVTLTWKGRVGPPLIVAAPASMSRGLGGGLAARIFSDQDVVARIPVTYTGGRIALGVELELRHLEIGAGLKVELRPRGQTTAELKLEVEGRGGDQSISRFAVCGTSTTGARGIEDQRPIDAPPERLELRIDYWPGTWPGASDSESRSNCRVWRGSDTIPYHAVLGTRALIPEGDYDVVLAGSNMSTLISLTEARFEIRRLEMVGLTVDTSDPSPIEQGHLAHANGDWETARALWQSSPGARPYTLWADLELVDEAQLSRVLSARLATGPAKDPVLAHALRTHRGRLAPLIERLDPNGFAARFAYSWGIALRYTALPEVRAALLDPVLARLDAGSLDGLRVTLARADLLYRLGEFERAYAAVTQALVAPTFEHAARPVLLAQTELLAARVAVARSDLSLAKTHLLRWRQRLPLPELALERLRVDPNDAELLPLLEGLP